VRAGKLPDLSAQLCPAISLARWLCYRPGDLAGAYRDWAMYWTPRRLRHASRTWLWTAR